jgi:hypothetical protein
MVVNRVVAPWGVSQLPGIPKPLMAVGPDGVPGSSKNKEKIQNNLYILEGYVLRLVVWDCLCFSSERGSGHPRRSGTRLSTL